jgi:hypothetical protein
MKNRQNGNDKDEKCKRRTKRRSFSFSRSKHFSPCLTLKTVSLEGAIALSVYRALLNGTFDSFVDYDLKYTEWSVLCCQFCNIFIVAVIAWWGHYFFFIASDAVLRDLSPRAKMLNEHEFVVNVEVICVINI